MPAFAAIEDHDDDVGSTDLKDESPTTHASSNKRGVMLKRVARRSSATGRMQSFSNLKDEGEELTQQFSTESEEGTVNPSSENKTKLRLKAPKAMRRASATGRMEQLQGDESKQDQDEPAFSVESSGSWCESPAPENRGSGFADFSKSVPGGLFDKPFNKGSPSQSVESFGQTESTRPVSPSTTDEGSRCSGEQAFSPTQPTMKSVSSMDASERAENAPSEGGGDKKARSSSDRRSRSGKKESSRKPDLPPSAKREEEKRHRSSKPKESSSSSRRPHERRASKGHGKESMDYGYEEQDSPKRRPKESVHKGATPRRPQSRRNSTCSSSRMQDEKQQSTRKKVSRRHSAHENGSSSNSQAWKDYNDFGKYKSKSKQSRERKDKKTEEARQGSIGDFDLPQDFEDFSASFTSYADEMKASSHGKKMGKSTGPRSPDLCEGEEEDEEDHESPPVDKVASFMEQLQAELERHKQENGANDDGFAAFDAFPDDPAASTKGKGFSDFSGADATVSASDDGGKGFADFSGTDTADTDDGGRGFADFSASGGKDGFATFSQHGLAFDARFL